MDDYLSKPIDVARMIAAVERLGRQSAAAPVTAPASAPVPAASEAVTFDEVAALGYAGGDRRLLKQVVTLFRSDSAARLRAIDRAIRAKDGEALRVAAHTLKGAAAAVGAISSRTLAAALEQMGRSRHLRDAAQTMGELRQVLAELDAAFFRAGLASSRPQRRSSPRRSRGRRFRRTRVSK